MLRPPADSNVAPMDLAAYERYLLLERGHTPRGVRRYLRDLRLWQRFLQATGLPPGQEAVRRLPGLTQREGRG